MGVFNNFKKEEVKSTKNEHFMKTELDKIPLLKVISQAVRIKVTEHDARITIVLSPVHETRYVYMGLEAHTRNESGNT